ncbi:MAG: hypothetical protein U1E53_07975 [Dongiaceae bacterium]
MIAPSGLTVVDFHAVDATTLTVTIRIAPGTAPGSKTLKIRAPSGTDNAVFKVIRKAGGGSYQ